MSIKQSLVVDEVIKQVMEAEGAEDSGIQLRPADLTDVAQLLAPLLLATLLV